jgi:L-ascorbate 6-phosphate lactonase
MSGLELTWLGQASFLLDAEATRILIDPWVSPHELRLIPPPPVEFVTQGIDAVLVTHEHLDHLDLPFLRTLAEASQRRGSSCPPRSQRRPKTSCRSRL